MDKAKLITFGIIGVIIIVAAMRINKLNKQQDELKAQLKTLEKK
jgi:hypothetical protein